MAILTNSRIYTNVSNFSLTSLELYIVMFCKLNLLNCFQPHFKSTKLNVLRNCKSNRDGFAVLSSTPKANFEVRLLETNLIGC